MQLPARPDVLAPDGSEIRRLPGPTRRQASLVHCRLAPGQVSKAIRHHTVEEVWFVTSGAGQLWRSLEGTDTVTELRPGVAVDIPLGAHFQFRAEGGEPLEIVIATFPPWPGAEEAISVPGHWAPGPSSPDR
ncbi:MAG: cupin domain-containing protein [Alphaproteobacteria bacterium]|nr:cupin domain-containing protein [Alphaproteobacteria bacterium]